MTLEKKEALQGWGKVLVTALLSATMALIPFFVLLGRYQERVDSLQATVIGHLQTFEISQEAEIVKLKEVTVAQEQRIISNEQEILRLRASLTEMMRSLSYSLTHKR